MIFHEKAQEVGESSAHQEGPASVSVLNPLTVEVPKIPIHFASDVVMEMARGSSDVVAARARDEFEAADARELPEFGWCIIV